MKTEGGRAGQVVKDGNGSFDMGPMQINSLWLPRLARIGITRRTLTDNGCLNITVGTAILALQIRSANGNTGRAIGWYHSHTPILAARYRHKVTETLENIKEELNAGDKEN